MMLGFMIVWTIIFIFVTGFSYYVSVKNYRKKLMTLKRKQYKYWVEIHK